MKSITVDRSAHSYLPEFIRLPRPGERCPYTGLSRTTLCELIANGSIESRLVRKPGRVRGIRLIVLRSLLDYLNSLPPG